MKNLLLYILILFIPSKLYAIDCEVFKNKLASIPETFVYISRYDMSIVKWFELKSCDENGFIVKPLGTFKHFENTLFGRVTIADWSYDFDISVYTFDDELKFYEASTPYNKHGMWQEDFNLSGSAFTMIAAYGTEPKIITTTQIFKYSNANVTFKVGDPMGVAIREIAKAYSRVERKSSACFEFDNFTISR